MGGGVDAATLWPPYAPARRRPPCAAGAAASTVGQRHAVCLYSHLPFSVHSRRRPGRSHPPAETPPPYTLIFTDGSYIKGTRAHTRRELIREWLCEPKGSSPEYIYVRGGGSRRRDPMAALRAGPPPIHTSPPLFTAGAGPGAPPGSRNTTWPYAAASRDCSWSSVLPTPRFTRSGRCEPNICMCISVYV